ncbi:MAG TPA: hypothetical protein VMJ10_18440 [Kofleriaceae bacterium]|nr:hypothetical protein [Kofleriaceae bacterium]
MRIGGMLIEQGEIQPPQLARVLEDQRRDPRRLISLLIDNDVVPFDVGSRVLGEQRRVPCLLTKHLQARSAKVAQLIPAELGRTWGAIPVGRTSTGTLIVAARDPSAQLLGVLTQAAACKVAVVIAPASKVDALIAEEYGPPPADEFDVDLDSALRDMPDRSSPPPPDMDILNPASVRLALADLDDVRVTKDPSQSGMLAVMAGARSGARTLPPPPPSLDSTRALLERATSRDEATDAAMAFIAGSWHAGLVVAIRDTQALGYRGHGPAIGAIETLVVELAEPSTLRRAVESKRTSIHLVDSPAQRELARRLGSASLAAAPIIVGARAIAAIVVGEPIQGLGETERWIGELGRLAQMLAMAYQRLLEGG